MNLKIGVFAAIAMSTSGVVAAQEAKVDKGQADEAPGMQFGQSIEAMPDTKAPQETLPDFEMFGLNAGDSYSGNIRFADKSCRLKGQGTENCTRMFGAKIGRATVSPLIALFENGKLGNVYGASPISNFRELASAFEAKYGDAHNVDETEWQNRMGARFDNIVMSWQFGDGVLQLKARGRELDSSEFIFQASTNQQDEEAPPINF